MTSYRKDIDGLRAISVIAVILFHSEINLFQGGFVGVDIFFVISGFLITKIIISEIFKKKFKLINFYKRRIKRLLPALLTIIVSSILIFWIIFLPTYYKDFLQSSFFSIIFLSNFLFYLEAGDYLVSSPIAGYCQKQINGILYNYTCAKVVIDCDFELDSDEYECYEMDNGVRCAFLPVVYNF